MDVIIPETKKIKTPEEIVEGAIAKAKEIYKRQFITCYSTEACIITAETKLIDTTTPILEIAKMILQEEK